MDMDNSEGTDCESRGVGLVEEVEGGEVGQM